MAGWEEKREAVEDDGGAGSGYYGHGRVPFFQGPVTLLTYLKLSTDRERQTLSRQPLRVATIFPVKTSLCYNLSRSASPSASSRTCSINAQASFDTSQIVGISASFASSLPSLTFRPEGEVSHRDAG